VGTTSAVMVSYDDQIRLLLDVVDRLRHLKVMQEGIQLPTIIVVDDQSSGNSNVLESLADISLSCGPVSATMMTFCTTMRAVESSGTSTSTAMRRGRQRQDSQHQVIHGDDLDIRHYHQR
jgi:type III secretory pathway component EscV